MREVTLEHLKTLPAYVITLGRTPERLAQFTTETSGLFKSTWPVMGFDAQAARPHLVHEWQVEQYETFKLYATDMLRKKPDPPTYMSLERASTWRAVSTTYAVYWSHLRALRGGIDAMHHRFIVCEDDIVPRSSLMQGDVPLPPEDSQFTIWSGALPRANLKADSHAYASGRPHKWVKVEKGVTPLLFGAGAYEVTFEAALHLYNTASDLQGQFDVVWALAMGEYPTYRVTPEALAQVGQSARISKSRNPAIRRDA